MEIDQSFRNIFLYNGSHLRRFTSDGLDVEQQAKLEIPYLRMFRFNEPNTLAFVSVKRPIFLKLINISSGKELGLIGFPSSITDFQLHSQRIVVRLLNQISIISMDDLKVQQSIIAPEFGSSGRLAISSHPDSCIFAYSKGGNIVVVDAIQCTQVTEIKAHSSPISMVSINAAGTVVASTTHVGTVLRVFRTDCGKPLYEFRRGLLRSVAVSCLNFSVDDQFLVSASNTDTVHIFKLDSTTSVNNTEITRTNSSSWSSLISGALKYCASFIPLRESRAFVSIQLPKSAATSDHPKWANIIRPSLMGIDLLYVVGTDKVLRTYRFDRDSGATLLENSVSLESIHPKPIIVTGNETVFKTSDLFQCDVKSLATKDSNKQFSPDFDKKGILQSASSLKKVSAETHSVDKGFDYSNKKITQ